jgi:hypothetical protein
MTERRRPGKAGIDTNGVSKDTKAARHPVYSRLSTLYELIKLWFFWQHQTEKIA